MRSDVLPALMLPSPLFGCHFCFIFSRCSLFNLVCLNQPSWNLNVASFSAPLSPFTLWDNYRLSPAQHVCVCVCPVQSLLSHTDCDQWLMGVSSSPQFPRCFSPPSLSHVHSVICLLLCMNLVLICLLTSVYINTVHPQKCVCVCEF